MRSYTFGIFVSRRVKKFVLFGSLFLALLSPLPASGQDLNAWVYAERWSYWSLPQHFGYWVGNQDDVPVAVVSITLNVAPGYDWIRCGA